MRNSVLTTSLVLSLGLGLAGCDQADGDGTGSGNVSVSPTTDPMNGDTGDSGATTLPPTTDPTGGDDAGTGGTPGMACVDLIDDLEHGAALIPVINDRQGAWYTYNDTTGTQTPVPMTDPFAPAMDGYDGSIFGAQTEGSGFTEWGAGMGFDLNNAGCTPDPETDECEPGDNGIRMNYDASAYQGISFWGKSNNGFDLNVQVKVPTAAETPIDEGGVCDPELDMCSDSYFAIVTLPPQWTLIQVPFDVLGQGAWGLEVPLDLTTTFGIQFQVAAMTDFDFTIDNVCFY